MWKFYKSRLVKTFMHRGWKVKTCENGELVVTTPKDIFFFGPDATPDNFLGFAWSSLIDNRLMFTFKKTFKEFLCLFDEINQ
jgi:hypothetical protein